MSFDELVLDLQRRVDRRQVPPHHPRRQLGRSVIQPLVERGQHVVAAHRAELQALGLETRRMNYIYNRASTVNRLEHKKH